LLITYDILDEDQQAYYQYVLGEFLPRAQTLGLVLTEAWHTAFGDYPARLLTFVARDRATLESILVRDEWQQLEDKLKTFIVDYQRRMAPYRDRFQF
jgi:hypothetical protein